MVTLQQVKEDVMIKLVHIERASGVAGRILFPDLTIHLIKIY